MRTVYYIKFGIASKSITLLPLNLLEQKYNHARERNLMSKYYFSFTKPELGLIITTIYNYDLYIIFICIKILTLCTLKIFSKSIESLARLFESNCVKLDSINSHLNYK